MPITGQFDGFHATQASVSKTCLVRFDNNKYSVGARAVGRPVEIQAYADRIVIRQDGAIVGEHQRRFGRGETIYDPWHYIPVLARKPGALRAFTHLVISQNDEGESAASLCQWRDGASRAFTPGWVPPRHGRKRTATPVDGVPAPAPAEAA